MRPIALVAAVLCLGLAPAASRAEEIPGFHPGIWAFVEKQDATDADIAAACRTSLIIVTPPNNAETVFFEKIEKPEAEGGKTLRGELLYVENCPEPDGSTLTCAGRSPTAKQILPTLFTYEFKKLPDGKYQVRAASKETAPVTYYPHPCPPAVIEEIRKMAILPKGVSLDRR
jgi:hypothetical protein